MVGVCALALAPAAKATLFHDSFSPAYRSPGGAVPTSTPVRLRLRVTGERAKSVALRVEIGDPISDTSSVRMLRMKRAGAFWSVSYRTPAGPAIVSYSFRVSTPRGVRWYGDDDSSNDTRKGGTGRTTRSRGDSFQLTVYGRSFTTPSWLQGAVVYEIFVDRFRNGDPSKDPCRSACPVFYGNVPAILHPTWNEPVEDARATGFFNRDFFGGDLEGVTQKLDYLKSLGIDAIWLTPIFKARSNHRYDTDDYTQVDPSVGGDAAFAALRAAAQAHGIRLILDGVFNHTSSDSRYFDRYHRYPDVVGACESPSSPYRDWYSITGSDVPCTNYTFFANDTLPQLTHSNDAARDFIDGVVRHWSPDGWRLDAAQAIPPPWWVNFRSFVKGYAPDTPLIAEDTAGPVDASPYLTGLEFDGVMNYRFRQAAIGFAQNLTAAQLDHSLKAILEDYPRAAAAVSFNLVDSHDTSRISYAVGDAQRLVAMLQFTSLGAPMVYYGDEAGIVAPDKNGFADPYNRAPYPWADQGGSPDQGLIDYYARLAAVRHKLPALRLGSLVTLSAKGDVYAFERVLPPDKPVIVVLNKGASSARAQSLPSGAFVDQVTGVPFSGTIPARSGVILVETG